MFTKPKLGVAAIGAIQAGSGTAAETHKLFLHMQVKRSGETEAGSAGEQPAKG